LVVRETSEHTGKKGGRRRKEKAMGLGKKDRSEKNWLKKFKEIDCEVWGEKAPNKD